MKRIGKSILAAAAATAVLGAGVTAAYGNYDGGSSSSNYGGSYGSRACGSYTFGLQVLALTSDNKLLCFSEERPGDVRTVSITRIGSGESIIGIDYRPLNSKLYAATKDAGGTGRAYTVDPSSGVATLAFTVTGATLSGTQFGVDFNPAADRLRIISDNGQNLRIVPDGAAVGTAGAATTDQPLKYGTTPATNVTGAAYTNNDNDGNGTTPAGSTGTTLYDIDTDKDQLVIQAPPNDGTLVAIGSLGVNTTNVVGFDMHSTIRNGTTTDIRALAVLTVGTSVGLYRLTPFSGRAQLRGALPANVVDIAIPLSQL